MVLPGTLVIGGHIPCQAQLRNQRGLPWPPPAVGYSLPHLLLYDSWVSELWGDGLLDLLLRKVFLDLLLSGLLCCLLLFLLFGPLLGKK